MSLLLYDKEWLKKQNDKFLLLDTCVLIELARSTELQKVFKDLNNSGCRLIVTADVRDEFCRGSKTSDEYDRCKMLLEDLMITVFGGAETFGMTRAGGCFQLALRAIAQKEARMRQKAVGDRAAKFKPSLIDERLLFLTTATLFDRHILLVTSNYSDVPLNLYQNEQMIAISDDGGIRNIGFYSAKMPCIAKAISEADGGVAARKK